MQSSWADERGLAGDRAHALVDLRQQRAGTLLTVREQPRLLSWQATYDAVVTDPDRPPEPLLTDPHGRSWRWSERGLAEAMTDDLGQPVGLVREPAGLQDLERSILLTTAASHADLEREHGRRYEPDRWRTNLHVDLDAVAFAEQGWEGLLLQVGELVLRLLHPCGRCAIPTWSPDGTVRDPGLLRALLADHAGAFGINARVVTAGVLRVGDDVRLLPGPAAEPVPRLPRRRHPR